MTLFIILLFASAAFLILLFIYTITNPNDSFVLLLINWKYRVLNDIFQCYQQGLKRNPPDSYEHFCSEALSIVSRASSSLRISASEQQRDMDIRDIINMLNEKQYIRYYFTNFPYFTGEVYGKMWNDYRSGQYKTKDYFLFESLKKILPLELSASDGAISDFAKFVEVGWFDKESGFYNKVDKKGNKIPNYYIGRAIYWICHRNSISSPEKVFASMWVKSNDEDELRKEQERLRQWLREDRISDKKKLDNIIDSILRK